MTEKANSIILFCTSLSMKLFLFFLKYLLVALHTLLCLSTDNILTFELVPFYMRTGLPAQSFNLFIIQYSVKIPDGRMNKDLIQ